MADHDDASDPVPSRQRARRRGVWSVRLEGEDEDREAIDLSAGGLFVRHVTSFAPGDRVRLELRLGDGPVAASAVARWVREVRLTAVQPEGTGLAFEDLSDDDGARILAEIERETP